MVVEEHQDTQIQVIVFVLVINNGLQIVWGINDGKASPATLALAFKTTKYIVACASTHTGYTNVVTSRTLTTITHDRYNGTSSNIDIMYICIGR